jgi:Fe-S-cluster containining protein
MGVDCLKCINSACCKLTVQVSEQEYKDFKQKGLSKNFLKLEDEFINKFPEHIDKVKLLSHLYVDVHATMKKNDDGYCIMLDKETMLCSIYKDRPKVCMDFKNTKCKTIREPKQLN